MPRIQVGDIQLNHDLRGVGGGAAPVTAAV
jgi:hypothetical protein